MRRSFKILGLALGGFVILSCVGIDLLILPLTLCFGWIAALRRIVTAMAANPNALAWAGAAVALVVLGTQWLASWFWRSWRAVAEGRSSCWRWRWTFMLHGGLGAVLFAAMSVLGMAHQTGWLIAAREPIFVSRIQGVHARMAMQMAADDILQRAAEHRWDPVLLQTELWGAIETEIRRESVHAVLLPDTDGRIARVLLLPGDPRKLPRTGVGIVEPDRPYRTEPAAALTNLLELRPPNRRTAGLTP